MDKKKKIKHNTCANKRIHAVKNAGFSRGSGIIYPPTHTQTHTSWWAYPMVKSHRRHLDTQPTCWSNDTAKKCDRPDSVNPPQTVTYAWTHLNTGHTVSHTEHFSLVLTHHSVSTPPLTHDHPFCGPLPFPSRQAHSWVWLIRRKERPLSFKNTFCLPHTDLNEVRGTKTMSSTLLSEPSCGV